jgi:predicted enzyme related to lactoylglutathione lyase
MKPLTIDLVLLHVADIETTRAFYTEKLGLQVNEEQSGANFVLFTPPEGRGTPLALSLEEDRQPANSMELWWYVQDVDATHDELAARGAEAASPLVDMPFGRTFSIKDPNGHVIHLLQPRP